MTFSGGRNESDPRVLFAATGGDVAARWRALEACREYLRLVVRRRRLSRHGDHPATSDLVQQTIVDGWANFPRFHGRTPGQLRAWLRAILIHASLKARRRPGEAEIGSGREVVAATAPGSSPSQAAQKKDAGEALDAAIGGLMERHRTIIRLRIWEQLSFREIGERLGVSETSVKGTLQQLFRKTGVHTRSQLVRVALERLRDQL